MEEKYGKIDGTSIETPLNCKQLISLNYPGVVKNPSMMIETLGGESKLTKVSFYELINMSSCGLFAFPRRSAYRGPGP